MWNNILCSLAAL